MFRLQAEARGLAFRHSRAPNLPQYARTDEKRLRQILVNLLSNAIKFTDEGFVDFAVGYRSQVATFTVTDSGHGIAQSEIGHIFEPFVRGKSERNRLLPGLGLGLTITKLLSETLGGEISVKSEAGQGSTFKVRLMLAKVDRPAQRAADRRIKTYKGPRRTIMVVDDNADHREMMREMLQPLDFTVLTAVDAPDCLTLIAGIKPDLFFIDILMPGMNGWELVDRLRAIGQAAPIVMLSANIGDGAAKTNSDAGHNDAIAKPFTISQLLDKLEAHLELEWEEEEQAKPAQAVGKPNGSKLKSPGSDHLRELVSLGQIGHVRGIDAKLTELALEPQNGPLVDVLRARMEAYDFAGYAEVLENVTDHD
jgi:CheY-like chemotaxis protein